VRSGFNLGSDVSLKVKEKSSGDVKSSGCIQKPTLVSLLRKEGKKKREKLESNRGNDRKTQPCGRCLYLILTLDCTAHKAQHFICFSAPASLTQRAVGRLADDVPQSHDVTPGN